MAKGDLLKLFLGMNIPANDSIDSDLALFYDEKVEHAAALFCGSGGLRIDGCSLRWHLNEVESEGNRLSCRMLHFKEGMKFWTVEHVSSFLCNSPDILNVVINKFGKVKKCLSDVLVRYGPSYSFSNGGYDVSGGAMTMLEYCEDIMKTLSNAGREDEEIAGSEERCLEQKKKYDKSLKATPYYKAYMDAYESNTTMFNSLPDLERMLAGYDKDMRSTETWKIVDGKGLMAGGEGRVAQGLRHLVFSDDYDKYYCTSECVRRTSKLINLKRLKTVKKNKKSWLKDGYNAAVFRSWLKEVFDEVFRMRGELTPTQYAFVFYRVCVDMGYAYEWNVLNFSDFKRHLSDSNHCINNIFNKIVGCFKESESLYVCPCDKFASSQSAAMDKIFGSDNKMAMNRLEEALRGSLASKQTSHA